MKIILYIILAIILILLNKNNYITNGEYLILVLLWYIIAKQ